MSDPRKQWEEQLIALGGVLHRSEDFGYIHLHGSIMPARSRRTVRWEETLFSPAGLGVIFGKYLEK